MNINKICKFCNKQICAATASYKRNRFGTLCLRNECKPCRVVQNSRYKRFIKEEKQVPCEICQISCTKRFKKALCSTKCRFLSLVNKTEGCWIWKGSIHRDGYGFLMVNNKPDQRASRVSYELFNGPIKEGMFILHGPCSNKLCVNPSHLRQGTNKENMQDAKRDGVIYKGQQTHTAKLTEKLVKEIRNLKNMTQNEIAKKYKICRSNVSIILNRKSWKHI